MIFLRSSFIFSRVYTALAQREGKNVTLPTLASVTGLTEGQIKNTIANARRTSAMHARQIQVVKLGRVWKLRTENDNSETPEQVAQEVEMGAQHIWKVVLTALMDNADKISSKDLLAERASTPERQITPQQVTNAMDTIMRRPGIGKHIEIKWARNAWKYVPPATTQSSAASKTKEEHQPVSTPIRGSVLRYFAQHPGETLFRDDIAADLGFTVKQVQSAVWHLLNENEGVKNDFEVVQSSYAWRYKPNRPVDVKVNPESNGHVTPELTTVPAQEHAVKAYTPQAVTTTLPVTSKVPNIPQVARASTAVATSGRLFEEIGQTTEGAVLVKESETGTIYRATPLA